MRNRQVGVAYFGTDGKPIISRYGYAKAIWSYDAAGNQIDLTYFDAQGLEIRTEVVVVGILPGTTAEQIGLSVNDVLLSYDGVEMATSGQLVAMVATSGSGEHILVVRRGLEVLFFKIPPGRIGVNLQTALVAAGQNSGPTKTRSH